MQPRLEIDPPSHEVSYENQQHFRNFDSLVVEANCNVHMDILYQLIFGEIARNRRDASGRNLRDRNF